jgi:hypothetical protein
MEEVQANETPWPQLDPVDNFLRCVRLRHLLRNQDEAVQPYKMMREELDYRRSDETLVGKDGGKLTVEEVNEYRKAIDQLKGLVSEQHDNEKSRLRRRCSHKYGTGESATQSVPVSCESYCRSCENIMG